MDYFITREEYLDARKAWKKEYLRKSNHIHVLKKLSKAAAKGGYTAASAYQSMRAVMSNEAFEMMLDLEDLKDLSRRSVEALRLAEDWEMFLATRNH